MGCGISLPCPSQRGREAVRCPGLAVLQRGFQRLLAQRYLWISDAHSLFFCAPLFFPQLEPLGEKTDNQRLEEEIVLKCPSDVSDECLCFCGGAGRLREPLPAPGVQTHEGGLTLPHSLTHSVSATVCVSP